MTNYQRELDSYAAETETTPTDMAIARLRWEEARPDRRASPWLSPFRLVFAGGMVAAAAALLLTLLPATPDNLLDPVGPVALGEQALPVDVALPEGISISGEGQGVLSGTSGDRAVALESGRMRFEVTPNAGLHLQVNTSEGTATVLGTVFDVDRGALGTTVSVERGKVQVDCEGREAVYVTAGKSETCYSAQGYLDHGRALQKAGEAPEVVLDAIASAGAVDAEPAFRAELEVLRIDSLSRLSRHDEVLTGAESFLADDMLVGAAGEHRPAEMRRLAARAAAQVGGCERAMPWLDALRSGAEAEGADLVQYATCVGKSDPDAARAALEEALGMALDPKLEARIRKLLGR